MRVWVVFDWVVEEPVAVYSSDEKAAALCEKHFREVDEPKGNKTSAWEYAEFEIDVELAMEEE